MDVSLNTHMITAPLLLSILLSKTQFKLNNLKNYDWGSLLGFFLDAGNQVDNTGMLEFQEFKVFWEKMKKWIVRVGLKSGNGGRSFGSLVPGLWFRLLKMNLCCYRCSFWPLTPTGRGRCRPTNSAVLSMLQVRVDYYQALFHSFF